MAITLSFIRESAFPFLGGDGIAFDATSGDLFAVGSRQVENLPGDADNLIRAEAVLARFSLDDAQNGTLLFEKNLTQEEITVTEADELPGAPLVIAGQGVDGFDIIPTTGNFLISAPSSGRILEIAREDFDVLDGSIPDEFTSVPGGINFQDDSFRFTGATQYQPLGSVLYNPDTSTIFTIFDPGDGVNVFLREFNPDGTFVSDINLAEIVPNINPEGVDIDPVTGNFLVLDDAGAFLGPPGNSSVHEITPSGELLSSVDLIDLRGDRKGDPEGIAIDDENRIAYIIFDNDAPGTVQDPPDTSLVGNQIAAFQIEDVQVSEPPAVAQDVFSPGSIEEEDFLAAAAFDDLIF